MNDVKKKGILMILSAILLIAVLLGVSFAWYTKMTSIGGMNFQVAKWDFNANYQVSDFKVNVYEYASLTHQYAAPGTKGTIEVQLSAEGSKSDVDYFFTVDKSTMSLEFQKRVFFYYLPAGVSPLYEGDIDEDAEEQPTSPYVEFTNDNGVGGTVTRGTKKTETIYWKWIYDYAEYLSLTDEAQYKFVTVIQSLFDDSRANLTKLIEVIDGVIASGEGTVADVLTDQTIFVRKQTDGDGHVVLDEETGGYVYENYALETEDITTLATYIQTKLGADASFTLAAYWADYLEKSAEYDAFDTYAGMNVAIAQEEMNAVVRITGNEVDPLPTGSETMPVY